ncbi:unnamed protein product, partial [Iphiclides podalirius]
MINILKHTARRAPASGSTPFKLVARTQAEEDAYNYVEHRVVEKPSGVVGSVAHIVKGALGAGVLSGHVAYKTGGVVVGIVVNLLCAIYMTYCLYILVKAAQVLYRRCRVPTMTYPDVGEAACAVSTSPKVTKFAKTFRYIIDVLICIDLFGSCAAYQIIIAKSIKQLVENVPKTSFEGANGLPGLRVYLACMIVPLMLICLIRHLKWLAPLSIVANLVVLLCLFVAIYYAFEYNPSFTGMVPYTTPYEIVQFIGMSVFSMSCVCVVIPIENNMKDPKKYGLTLTTGMLLIFTGVSSISFFGYAGFLEESESPITVNFPLNTTGKILKACIAVMIYVTHALNFWVPFNTVFVYLQKRHNPQKILLWEMFYRVLFVFIIAVTAITFPTITALIGFLGAFCLTNLGFIFPNIIHLLVIWERPGLGPYKWRLWLALAMIVVGSFLGICGTAVSLVELLKVAFSAGQRSDL